MDVTIVVATYGNKQWVKLAHDRAVPSALALHGDHDRRVVWNHGTSLHGSRNAGLRQVETEWVCFLDADDQLHPEYLNEMEKATADVRAPSVSYIQGRHVRPAMVPNVSGHSHACTAECLSAGNWLVIGSLVRADLVRQVGGFEDYPWSEDWALWVRCWQAGATFEAVPGAVYLAHVRSNSRNRGASQAIRLESHRAIARDLGLPVP